MMLKRIYQTLFSEKIPTIICLLACTASVFMGFAIGYILFTSGENTLVYADTGPPFQAESTYQTTSPEIHDEILPDAIYHRQVPHEETPSYLYVVSVLDGYVVVYHAPGFGGGIKELTNTPISTLGLEELDQLTAGIKIYSDEALARILQDFGS